MKHYKESEWLGRKVRFVKRASADLEEGAVRTICIVDEDDPYLPFKVGIDGDHDQFTMWIGPDYIELYEEKEEEEEEGLGHLIDVLIGTENLTVHRGRTSGRVHIYDKSGHAMVANSQLEDLITVLQYAKMLNDESTE